MYERFTDRARKVMQLANQEAQRFNHEYVGTEHILLGLCKEGSGIAAMVLKNLEVDLKTIRLEVEKIVQSGPDMVIMGKLPITPRAKRCLEYAMEEARNLNHNYVGTEHLLLGLILEEGGVASNVLRMLGIKVQDIRHQVNELLGTQQVNNDARSAGEHTQRQQQQVNPFIPLLNAMFGLQQEIARRQQSTADQAPTTAAKTFNVGDRVRCIDNTWCEHYLTVGQEYTVANTLGTDVALDGIGGKITFFFHRRFELVAPAAKPTESAPAETNQCCSTDQTRVCDGETTDNLILRPDIDDDNSIEVPTGAAIEVLINGEWELVTSTLPTRIRFVQLSTAEQLRVDAFNHLVSGINDDKPLHRDVTTADLLMAAKLLKLSA